jgi:hypothetical protein
MDSNPVFDVSSPRDARIAEISAAIRSGTYAPAPEVVAESLVGWIATPDQFDRPVKFSRVPVDRNNTETTRTREKDHETRR